MYKDYSYYYIFKNGFSLSMNILITKSTEDNLEIFSFGELLVLKLNQEDENLSL